MSNFTRQETGPNQVTVQSERLDLKEFAFILPDLILKNNPELIITSLYDQDSLNFEIGLQSENEHLAIQGLFNNYQALFDSSKITKINFFVNLMLKNIKPQNWFDDLPDALVSGDIHLFGSFTGLEDLQADIKGNFQDLQLNDYSADILRVDANYRAGDITGNIFLKSKITDLDFKLDIINLPDHPLFDGTLAIHHLDLGELFFTDSIKSDLNFKLYLQGEEFLPPANRLKVTSEWAPSFINQMTIDTLLAEIHLNGTQYLLDTLHIQTPAGIFSGKGSGDLASNHDIDYHYQIGDWQEIAHFIGADSLKTGGNISGSIYGNPDTLKNDMTFNLHKAVFNGLCIDSLSGNSQLILLDSDPTVKFDFVAKRLNNGIVNFDTVRASSFFDDDQLFSDIKIQFDPNLRSEFTTVLRLDSLLVLSVPNINFTFLEDYWSGKLESIIYDPSQENFILSGVNIECTTSQNERRIFAEGRLSPSGAEDFKFGIQGIYPNNILSYLDIDSRINGIMNFNLELAGTADKPEFKGNVQLEKGTVGSISYQDMNSWFNYADNTFKFYYSLDFNGQDSLTAQGHLPLHFSLTDTLDILDYNKSISLAIKSESIPINLFLQNVKSFSETSGTLLCDFTFSNTLSHPNIQGFFQLTDGVFKSPYWGIDYQDIDMKISANDDKFSLDKFEIKSSDGTMNSSGEIQFEYGENEDKVIYSNMNLVANNFYLLKHRDFEIMISADIKYQMENNKPTIGGYLNINKSSFYLPTVLERTGNVINISDEIKPALIKARERRLGLKDSRIEQAKVGAQADTIKIPGFLDLLKGELDVRIDRNTWIRNPQLRVELGGNFKMIFDKGDFLLKGPVDIVRGQYDLLGRRFIVNQGKIEFLRGEFIKSPLFLEAEYVYRTVGREKKSLIIEISGNLEYPIITFLENKNPISRDDAISIVLYGRKRDELSYGTQSDMTDMAGSSAALGYVSNLVSDRLTRSVGDDLSLDVIEVNATDNWQSANFVVGKYITENIFVTYKREFGQNMDNNLNPETISMEYEIRRNFFFQLIQGNPQESGYDLLLRFNWD